MMFWRVMRGSEGVRLVGGAGVRGIWGGWAKGCWGGGGKGDGAFLEGRGQDRGFWGRVRALNSLSIKYARDRERMARLL